MDNTTTNENAGLLRRFFANFIDINLSWLIFSLVLFVFTLIYSGDPYSVDDIVNIFYIPLLWFLISQIIFVFYHVYMIKRFGGTLGKLAFGMKIVDRDTGGFLDWKTALYRVTAGYGFSGQFLGLGFWRIIKNDHNLGWHDELFNTRVTRETSSARGFVTVVILAAITVALFSISVMMLSSSEFYRSLVGLISYILGRPLIY